MGSRWFESAECGDRILEPFENFLSIRRKVKVCWFPNWISDRSNAVASFWIFFFYFSIARHQNEFNPSSAGSALSHDQLIKPKYLSFNGLLFLDHTDLGGGGGGHGGLELWLSAPRRRRWWLGSSSVGSRGTQEGGRQPEEEARLAYRVILGRGVEQEAAFPLGLSR